MKILEKIKLHFNNKTKTLRQENLELQKTIKEKDAIISNYEDQIDNYSEISNINEKLILKNESQRKEIISLQQELTKAEPAVKLMELNLSRLQESELLKQNNELKQEIEKIQEENERLNDLVRKETGNKDEDIQLVIRENNELLDQIRKLKKDLKDSEKEVAELEQKMQLHEIQVTGYLCHNIKNNIEEFPRTKGKSVIWIKTPGNILLNSASFCRIRDGIRQYASQYQFIMLTSDKIEAEELTKEELAERGLMRLGKDITEEDFEKLNKIKIDYDKSKGATGGEINEKNKEGFLIKE